MFVLATLAITFDHEALNACVTRLKSADPAFSGDGERLLPDVSFAVVR